MGRTTIMFACVAAIAACSCSGGSPAAGTTAADCRWNAAWTPADAGDGRCQARRHRVSCVGVGGPGASNSMVYVSCLSDTDTCEGLERTTPGVTYTCHDECAPNEFGMVCGRIGPGGGEAPPGACTKEGPTPAGISFYCCPCGT
jgi:hypothetical protein